MKKKGFTHESSHNESKEWYTPAYIFKWLGLRFDMDVASPGADLVPWIPADKHLTIREDGLSTPWKGRCWLNPPYGQDTPAWLKKMVMHYLAGHATGVALVFSRTDTQWFQDWALVADAWCFIKRRVKFVSGDPRRAVKGLQGAGAGSLLLAYGQKEADAFEALHDHGLVVRKERGYSYIYEPVAESKHSETFRMGERFAGDKSGARRSTAYPHENPPGNAEPATGLF